MKGLQKYNLTLNKSGFFFLPLLDVPIKYLDSLVNSYLNYSEGDSTLNRYTIYLVFDRELLSDYSYKTLCENENIVDLIFPDNPDLVIVKFIVPVKYRKSVDIMLSGEYSQLDKGIKEIIVFYWCPQNSVGMTKATYIYRALYPGLEDRKTKAMSMGVSVNDLVKGEIISKINMLNETYFDSDIYKLVKG